MSTRIVDSTVTTPPVRVEESSSLLTPTESNTTSITDRPLTNREQMYLARQARHAESEAAVKANPALLETKRPIRRTPRPMSDKKMYKRALAIVAMRAQGISTEEIATTLGCTKDRVKSTIYYANKHGWLNINSFHDPTDQLEYILQSKAVRNINALLDGDEDFKGDKDTTLEVAKGLGLLKQHQVAKPTETSVGVGLRVEVVMPSSVSGSTEAVAGNIGGAPFIDAEIAK